MKYYLIVGEASGDLHASHLMRALKNEDPAAEFRFFGGDLMAAEGGTLVRHYRDLAYMGFIPVLMHLPTILRNMRQCKQDIVAWQPDVVILVDYPGFNLKIAKFVHSHTRIPVYYYISPKIWAWKEYRIKNIRRDVDELFSILPFEVPFFEQKHHYPIHYVGNPTADEVREFLVREYGDSRGYGGTGVRGYEDTLGNGDINGDGNSSGNTILVPPYLRTPVPPSPTLVPPKKTIALLAGSRKQEIKDNLPAMLEAASAFDGYELVVAGAPSIEPSFYEPFVQGYNVKVLNNQTFDLLAQSTAALVTSGTATLETALFRVPQVVCYKTPVPRLVRFAFNHIIKCRYISLVNLIADREVVPELLADRFSTDNIRRHLAAILPGGEKREEMLSGYADVSRALGDLRAPDNAAAIMVEKLRAGKNTK